MRKAIAVFGLLLLLASCSDKKKLTDNIQGTWYIYKLVRYNVDLTNVLSDSLYNYRVTYSGSNYVENNVVYGDTTASSGTWEFRDNYESLAMIDTAKKERVFTIFNLTGNHVELRRNSESRYMRKVQ
ncbi:MAG: DUF5004 domain-containing protein [Chitinophagales bacterium]